MPDKLYDYLFHYNIYTGYWHAFKRDQVNDHFNGTLKKGDILKDKNKDKLISKLTK